MSIVGKWSLLPPTIGVNSHSLNNWGRGSWPLVRGNFVLSLGAKILAAGRSRESAVTRRLEYNYN